MNTRILHLDFDESGFNLDESRLQHHLDNYKKLEEVLIEYVKTHKVDEVFTHNTFGEYGHSEHILVHDVVKKVFSYSHGIPFWTSTANYLPTNNVVTLPRDYRKRYSVSFPTDLELYRQTKALYQKYGVWTWIDHYTVPSEFTFYREY